MLQNTMIITPVLPIFNASDVYAYKDESIVPIQTTAMKLIIYEILLLIVIRTAKRVGVVIFYK